MENKKPESQRAFPVVANETVYEAGMTLRDYFATKAMQAIVSNPLTDRVNGNVVSAHVIKKALELADEMLKQREL